MARLDLQLVKNHGGTPTRDRFGVRCMQLHGELWRVTRPDGEVLGYVEQFSDPRGIRFRAKRLVARAQHFLIVGEFWAFDEAVDALR
jgi:hypothetical protein